MGLLHRTVNIDNYVGLAIHENGGFHCIEVVSNTFTVLSADRSLFEAGGVDSLHVTEFVKRNGQSKEDSPDLHFNPLLASINGREVR